MTQRIVHADALREFISANGLLAGSEATLWQCPPQTQTAITVLICCNIDEANDNTVYLCLLPAGGTSRCFKQETLAAGESLESIEGSEAPLYLNEGDALRGYATHADEVTWTIAGQKETRV